MFNLNSKNSCLFADFTAISFDCLKYADMLGELCLNSNSTNSSSNHHHHNHHHAHQGHHIHRR